MLDEAKAQVARLAVLHGLARGHLLGWMSEHWDPDDRLGLEALIEYRDELRGWAIPSGQLTLPEVSGK